MRAGFSVLTIFLLSTWLQCMTAQGIIGPKLRNALHLGDRRVAIRQADTGDWEEATLVDVDDWDDEDGGVSAWGGALGGLINLWKRQTTSGGGTSAAGAGGNLPIANSGGGTNNLTNSVTTNTSGPAGNNTSGTVPGLIGNEGNPNSRFVNCSDITTGRSDKCWGELNLTRYVKQWLNQTVCTSGEGFASCFLRQNGFPSLDCSHISVAACPAPQSDRINNDPRLFYIAYNIYAINAFFYSWWLAVGSSSGIASNNIGQIVQIIDVPSSTPVVLQKVLIALQSVFALIPGPLGVYAAHHAFSAQWQTLAQVLSNAINVVPNVGRYLFPADSAASQVIQLAELSANFATILMQVQSNLNQTLTSVMANVTEFLAFAEQGNFSANAPSLPDQANYLYFAFNTYIISQALNGNNIVAVIGRDTNPKELNKNGTKTQYDIPCDDYNENNVCDAWWYSENYKSAFTLDDFSKQNRNMNKQLNQLLANLTTGQLLFEAAYQCNSQGSFGAPVNITVSTQGVNTACISQLKVLTWDMACSPSPNTNCEFIEEPKQKSFGGIDHYDGSSGLRTPVYGVPYGYLGPGLTSKTKKLDRT